MKYLISLALLSFVATANAGITLQGSAGAKCGPSVKEPYKFSVKGARSGSAWVELRSPDDDLVRTLKAKDVVSGKDVSFTWDGRDSRGEHVPDEAYVPVVFNKTGDGSIERYDPRETSGGEELKIPIIQKGVNEIIFDVPAPARVSLRAGTKSGPMLNNLLDFTPRAAGRNRVAWTGRDASGVMELAGRDDFVLVSTGFGLPDNAIICSGNESLGYADWRARHYPPVVEPDLSKKSFERGGQRISRFAYLPRSLLASPRLDFEILGDWPRNADGIAVVSGPVSFKLDMPKTDLWALQQSQFEVAFYVDLKFISEQEQGYAPITWRWLPGGEAPGIKLITVNVSGYNGQVAARTLVIDFQPTERGTP